MPSCFSASLVLQAFAEEFQQLSGEIGPNNLISLFLFLQEFNAEIVEILVENGTPVEFGQVLMRVKQS